MMFGWRSFLCKLNLCVLILVSISLTGQSARAIDRQSAETSQRITAEQPIVTTIKPLLAQKANAAAVTIVGVKINPTATSVEIVLETTTGNIAVPASKTQGKILYFDLPNAALSLGENREFRVENPVTGIANVVVTQTSPTDVRVQITGTEGVPTAAVVANERGLVITPVSAAATVAETPAAADDIEITVTGRKKQPGYQVPNATTATKTDTPLRDIPFSAQVVLEQVLKDRKVRRLTDAFQGVSGVTSDQSEVSVFESFVIRGFGTSNSILRNGILDTSAGTIGSGVANVDRVEVLKGPAGALFGQGSPGGTVNIVTKKPLTRRLYDVEASVGNFNSYEGKIDVSEPLNADKTLLSRFTASANTYQAFNQANPNNRYFISPVLTWLISKDTKLTFEAEYLSSKNPEPSFLPAVGTVLPNPNGRIPYNFYAGEPSVDGSTRSVFRIGYDLEHRLNDNWQLNNAVRTSFDRNQSSAIFGGGLLEDNRTFTRQLQVNDDPNSRYQIDTYILCDVKTGSIEHKLLFGVNLSRETGTGNGTKQFELASIDLFDPVYGRQTVGPLTNEFFKDNLQVNDGLGVYLQDQLTITKNFKVLLEDVWKYGEYKILRQVCVA